MDSKTATDPDFHRLLKWLRTVFVLASATVAEWRACAWIRHYFPQQFIRGLERSPSDAGIFLIRKFKEGDTDLERHSQVKAHPNDDPYVSIEIKAVTARIRRRDPRDIGGSSWRYSWDVVFRDDTRDDGIIILVSAADPKRLVICPAAILLKMFPKQEASTDRRMYNIETCIRPNQSYAPSFPYKLQPYVILFSDLPVVLGDLLEHFRGKKETWYLPQKMMLLPLQQRSKPTCNINRLNFHSSSETLVCELHNQWKQWGSKYEIQTCQLAPNGGDLKIVRKEDGQEVSVEIKQGLLATSESNIVCQLLMYEIPQITWRMTADWLLSLPRDYCRKDNALFIPISGYPEHWIKDACGGVDYGSVPRHEIQQYLLPWESPPTAYFWKSASSELEQRLDQYIRGPLVTRPISKLYTLPLQSTQVLSHGSVETPENRDYVDQRAYAFEAAMALHEVFVKSGKGIVVDAGESCPLARYFFCRRAIQGPVSGRAALSDISRLPGTALLMPIEFVRLETGNCRYTRIARAYDLNGWGPGLLVFGSRASGGLHLRHGRFLIDSRDVCADIKLHVEPQLKEPLEWPDCLTTETDPDDKNVAQVAVEILRGDGATDRPAPVVLASTVFRQMLIGAKFLKA